MNTTKQTIELAFVLFAGVGIVFGYVMGRVHEMYHNDYPKQRKQRRTPEQRHTRSHW